MRQRRVFALVSMDELEADVAVQAVALAARWVYFQPPKLVFVPSRKPPFLPADSNRLAKSPKE